MPIKYCDYVEFENEIFQIVKKVEFFDSIGKFREKTSEWYSEKFSLRLMN